MHLIQIWIETTHFFIQVVKHIIICWFYYPLWVGFYVYDPIFFSLLTTKMEELSTTLFYI